MRCQRLADRQWDPYVLAFHYLFQSLPQTRPAPVQPRPHAVDRHAHQVGDLFVRQSFQQPQSQRGALLRWQALQLALDARPLLGAAQPLRRVALYRGRQRFRQQVERVRPGRGLRRSRLGAVQAVVDRQAAQPRAESAPARKLAQRLVGAHEHFLRRILGILRVTQDAAAQAIDGVVVPLHQNAECVLVACQGARDQFFVRWNRVHRRLACLSGRLENRPRRRSVPSATIIPRQGCERKSCTSLKDYFGFFLIFFGCGSLPYPFGQVQQILTDIQLQFNRWYGILPSRVLESVPGPLRRISRGLVGGRRIWRRSSKRSPQGSSKRSSGSISTDSWSRWHRPRSPSTITASCTEMGSSRVFAPTATIFSGSSRTSPASIGPRTRWASRSAWRKSACRPPLLKRCAPTTWPPATSG